MSPISYCIELELSHQHANESLKAILHTILFQRVFGNVIPREFKTLDVSFCAIDDEELAKMIDLKTNEALRGTLRDVNPGPISMIKVEFYEKQLKKAWFSTTEEEVCWEQWNLLLNFSNNPVLDSSQQLSKIMMTIINLVTNKKDHIPPITLQDKFVFPYKISVVTPTTLELVSLQANNTPISSLLS